MVTQGHHNDTCKALFYQSDMSLVNTPNKLCWL